ncbi:MAG TPA: hypothetical protein PKY82_10405 [Pyrinomonadaceae bacterium]|nr:hypothetical protein [Pyrinomonadaceae bacterium]
MKIYRVLQIIIILGICHNFIWSQGLSNMRVLEAKERPNLSVNYNQSVNFKIASNKTIYRVGDIIKITYAMLNKSEANLYLPQFLPEIILKSSAGKQARLEKYFIVDYKISPEMFDLTESNRLIVKSEYFHIGCNDEKFNRFLESKDNEKLIFERNLFAVLDFPCLRVDKTGVYTIKATQTNQFVVESRIERGVKTATGKIESNLLKLKIVK